MNKIEIYCNNCDVLYHTHTHILQYINRLELERITDKVRIQIKCRIKWRYEISMCPPVSIQQLRKVIVIGKGALIFGPSTTGNENTPSNPTWRNFRRTSGRRADSKSKYLRSSDWGHTHMHAHAHTHVHTRARAHEQRNISLAGALFITPGAIRSSTSTTFQVSRERLRDTRASGVSSERAIPIAYAGGLISHNLALVFACLRIGI